MGSPFTPIIMDPTSESHTGAEALVQQQEERLAATGEAPNPRRRTMFRLEDRIPEAMVTSGSMAPGTEPGTEQKAMAEEEDIEEFFSQEVSRIDHLDRITEQTVPVQLGQGQAYTPMMLPRGVALGSAASVPPPIAASVPASPPASPSNPFDPSDSSNPSDPSNRKSLDGVWGTML